jgi:Ala-tRNA(Pro) deacylase
MIAAPVQRYLESHRMPYRVLPHAARWTAQEVAHSAHVSGKQFAKAVVLRFVGKADWPSFVIAALPANERVDLEKLGSLLAWPVTPATEADIAALFPGIEIGAVPPLGEMARLPVIADRCLAAQRRITFHGGTRTELVEVSWDHFARATRPLMLDFGTPEAGGDRAKRIAET